MAIYKFITNAKHQNATHSKNNNNKSYSYGELDFVLKNDSEEDIPIDANFPPYKEKIFIRIQSFIPPVLLD